MSRGKMLLLDCVFIYHLSTNYRSQQLTLSLFNAWRGIHVKFSWL